MSIGIWTKSTGRSARPRRLFRWSLELTGAVSSVVDVGGGTGGWLREFGKAGVARLALIDSAAVEPHLLIPRECFHAADLERPLPDLGRFDLATSLECAEHLSQSRATSLVQWLTSTADVVLFSAAVPGQGGKGHINEQPAGFWSSLFRSYDFVRRDLVRQRILGDETIPYWYRQNLFFYVKQGRALADSSRLSAGRLRVAPSRPETVVHPPSPAKGASRSGAGASSVGSSSRTRRLQKRNG